MKNRSLELLKGPTLLVGMTALLCLGVPAHAQNTTTRDNRSIQDSGAAGRQLGEFDQFLDSHREIAEQVRRDPSLLDKRDFVSNHPELQTFLQDHPEIRDYARQNPDAFMQEANRFNRVDERRDRDELGRFHEFLDGHREVAEQCRRDPSLLNNRDFIEHHPDLRTYFEEHPGVRDQLRNNPNAFMQEQDRFNRPDDRNRDEMMRFHEFLDGHREVAEQVRRDPSLVDNRDFVEHHPDLKAFLQDHQGVRDGIRQDRYAFMQQENQLNRSNDARDRDFNHDHLASFGGFLGGHAAIAREVSQNPGVVKDRGYLDTHPEFKAYLDANPGVRDKLMQNPQDFVKRAQQFNNNGTNGTGSPMKSPSATPGTTPTTTPTPTPAPKREH
jgi:hypothetical protein